MCLVNLFMYFIVAGIVVVIYIVLGVNNLLWILWIPVGIVALIIAIIMLVDHLGKATKLNKPKRYIVDVVYKGVAKDSARPGGTKLRHRFILHYDNGDVETMICIEESDLYKKFMSLASGDKSTPENDKDINADGGEMASGEAEEVFDAEPLSHSGLKAEFEKGSFPKKQTADVTENIGVNRNEQAVIAAKEWLSDIVSREGLIESLQEDGFTLEQAKYAADHIGINWNKQAVIAAKDWLDSGPVSREELIEYLKDDGFTHAQAEYAADNSGINWNKQAEMAAKDWMDYEPASRELLIEYLQEDGFTLEQAKYAAKAVGAKAETHKSEAESRGVGIFTAIVSGLLEDDAPRKHNGRCDGDCANCPPHYGYRYGRWYYGRGHVRGCEFGGNRGDGGPG